MVRPSVTSTSGPYALEEPFGSAFSIVAAPDCTASKLSNWKTMATFGEVSLPLQSTAMKNAREFWTPGPLPRFCGICVLASPHTSNPASLSVVAAGS